MRRPVRALVVGVAVAIPVVVLLSLGFRGHNAPIASPLVGHAAPTFSLRTLDGRQTLALTSLRGRPVVLNFWQSSCIPCRQENPLLQTAYRAYGRRVAFIGVSYQDGLSSAQAYVRKTGEKWPTLRDPGGTTAIDYGVYGIPETFFIDRSGTIRYKSVGPVTQPVLAREMSVIVRSTL
jgi:cytochrome c biogenesis protein CcmG/thiol:disulfide interchange protein DsbE